MQRNELSLSDQKIIDLIERFWGFTPYVIEYVEFGSTFAFNLQDRAGSKIFLKIYRKTAPAAHLYNGTEELLQMSCKILDRLNKQHNMQQIPTIIKTNAGEYLHEFGGFMFVVLRHLEGIHPRYEPNELKSADLAIILHNLHAISVTSFPEVAREKFVIDFAVGLEKWFEIASDTCEEKIRPMLKKLVAEKEFLRKAIHVLKQLRKQFVNKPMDLMLTHGDAHHFNVLQTSKELYLIDWDDLKMAPRERDLWHYEVAPLMKDYMQLEPKFVLNHELCSFYSIQRFLEDLRIYIEEVTKTTEQTQINIEFFCNHWGWQVCDKQIRAFNS